jgi:glycosyltransferase involved in cell wall biosynthesis
MKKRKVLIITYNWPPAGGIAVHRCLKFAKYLRYFDWEPIIYTAKNAQYPYFDEGNFKHVPKDIEVLTRKIFEPYAIFKKLSGRSKKDPLDNPFHVRDKKTKLIDKIGVWIRSNFFIPDARAYWIRPSVRFLSKYLKNNKIDALLSDGPPHTNTAIACKISRKFNIPWLADFQDPWTQVDYYQKLRLTKWADKKHKRMEQEVFKTAAKITIASPTWAKDLEQIGANDVSPVVWGYDEDDYQKMKDVSLDKDFLITHTGLLGYDRHPKTLLKILGEMCEEVPDFKSKLKIELIGAVDWSIKEDINQLNLHENTILSGTVLRDEAIKALFRSQLLLLPLNIAENAKGRIPGKLFEYLRSQRPILCLGPTNSDVDKIITEVQHGQNFEYDDYEGLRGYISTKFNEFKSKGISDCKSDITKYSVRNQTNKIANYLDQITNN